MISKEYKVGDIVTAQTTNDDGDTIFISGEIRSINENTVFVTRRFPKIEHLFDKKESNGKTYLICIQAEEERKEQEYNRKKRSKAGKLGAKIRWRNLK